MGDDSGADEDVPHDGFSTYSRLKDAVAGVISTGEQRFLDLGDRYAIPFIQYSIAITFLWAGTIKLLPVTVPVRGMVDGGIPVPIELFGPALGLLEFIIGLCFLFSIIRIGTGLIVGHQVATFSLFFLAPYEIFMTPWLAIGGINVPWVLDIEAIFILKNLIILGAAVAVAAHHRDNPPHPPSLLDTRRKVFLAGIIIFILLFTFFWPAGAGGRTTGLYVTDYNQDGYPDVLATSGANVALFENTGGEFKQSYALPRLDLNGGPSTIEPVASRTDAESVFGSLSTVLEPRYEENKHVTGAIFFDYDNDGWDDLYLTTRRGSGIFLENVEGAYVKKDVGIPDMNSGWASGAAAADYDQNGCADLLVIRQGDWLDRMPVGSQHRDVEDDNGGRNVLLKNNCSRFTEADDAGIRGARWSQAASFADLTGDQRPDIHIANDFNNDPFYVNNGDGTFSRVELGAATDRNGMSSTLHDINQDGQTDIFVTNIGPEWTDLRDTQAMPGWKTRAKGNNVLINRNGSFVDRAEHYGLQDADFGWTAIVQDFTNDMAPEVYHNVRPLHIFYPWTPPHKPHFWTRNDDGTFTRAKPGFMAGYQVSAATLDYNRDGALDLVVGNSERGIILYENGGPADKQPFDPYISDKLLRFGLQEYDFAPQYRSIDFTDATGNWIQISVRGDRNTTALGATVTVAAGGETRTRQVTSSTNLLSQSTRAVHLGLEETETIERVAVHWPDGTTAERRDLRANQRLTFAP